MKLKAFITASIIYLSPQLQAQVKTIFLQVGQKKIIKINSQNPISISNSKIIQWQDGKHSLTLYAKKEGQTKITIGYQSYIIHILSKQKYDLFTRIKKWSIDKLGLTIHIEKNNILIKGVLLRLSDWHELSQLAKDSDSHFLFRAAIDTDIQKEALNYFNKKNKKHHYVAPRLNLKPWPQLTRISKPGVAQLDLFLTSYGIEIIENKSYKQQVELELYFTEIRESAQNQYGINWTGEFKAQLLPKFINSSLFEGSLSHGNESGSLKILNKATLLCIEGVSCEMSEGGEVPIKTQSFSYSSVQWKKYGLQLKFTTQILDSENFHFNLNYTLSHPDISDTADGVPSFKSKSIATQFNAQANKPLYIGGLSLQSQGKNSNGTLPFNLIPLIDAILNSNYSKKNKSNIYLIIKAKIKNKDSL